MKNHEVSDKMAMFCKSLLAGDGITKTRLADIMGVCPATLNSRLEGRSEFKLSEFERLALALRVDFNDLLEMVEGASAKA